MAMLEMSPARLIARRHKAEELPTLTFEAFDSAFAKEKQ